MRGLDGLDRRGRGRQVGCLQPAQQLLATALQLIGEDAELQQRLRDERDLIPNFVEESLRYESPVKGDFRLSRVPTNVGGVFGMKAFIYPEQALVVWAAGKLKRPVKWQSDRSEGFMSDNQGRDHVTRAELALDMAVAQGAGKVVSMAAALATAAVA